MSAIRGLHTSKSHLIEVGILVNPANVRDSTHCEGDAALRAVSYEVIVAHAGPCSPCRRRARTRAHIRWTSSWYACKLGKLGKLCARRMGRFAAVDVVFDVSTKVRKLRGQSAARAVNRQDCMRPFAKPPQTRPPFSHPLHHGPTRARHGCLLHLPPAARPCHSYPTHIPLYLLSSPHSARPSLGRLVLTPDPALPLLPAPRGTGKPTARSIGNSTDTPLGLTLRA